MTNSTPQLSHTIADIKAIIQRESRRVTSYDVAILAGVSQSAVSRCFKPGASVSKATYARVMQAAQDLDYTPNAAARSLITRRSNLVAVIVAGAVSQHYSDVLSELSRQFSVRGMHIILFNLPSESAMERTLAEVWQHQVDGAVVAARLSGEQAAEFERRRIPIVLFNRSLADRAVSAVVCNQEEAARAMVTRLAAAGHQRFAMIDGPGHSPIAQQRKRGVARRLEELGLPAPLVVAGAFDYASGARGLRDIIDRLGGVPDVIVCGNDLMAIGCLDSARHDFNIDVPGRLSVTGFDGIAAASWISYNLTTMRQPLHSMAHAAAEMLVGLVSGTGGAHERRTYSATFVGGGTARLGPA
ncbi:LacI family transcriptional regulator [Massilia sp. RP-1-19]|uniref:LacI family transcriptional regulator n=1 Tax=Massilia polaris TaxID=2728846 RepID=A0A848HKN2_9BURK|nr:LacI family DNA-binding transcriptional regulator [Massilia polaris]NML60750.1 LacI family transcriptional regulator [Massilia polaris]